MTMVRLTDLVALEVDEGATPIYRVDLESVDPDGVVTPIVDTDLDTLTLTLTQAYSHEVINARDEQDVLQTNDVTVDGAGVLRWAIDAEDTVILNDTLAKEPHRALFRWTYTTADGTRTGSHEFLLLVKNLVRPEG